jgi:quaternary ammonium compound-resistance protein SugE
MSWIYLVVAGLLEVGWAYSLKQSEGFSRLAPSVATIVLMTASFGFLSLALKQLPMGTAYSVWTGIGAVGTVIAGIVFLGESRDAPKLVCVALIATGIVGLKLFSKQ